MSDMNYTSGDQVAKAIDKRIIAIAKQVANKSTVNRTVYGRVIAKNQGVFSISINNTIYNNVLGLKHLGYLKVGDKVICLVPNNQFNDMVIIGIADGTINELNELSKEGIINLIYPINSVYINSIDINPSTFFGGTWQQLGTLSTPVVYFWVRVA